MTEALGSLIEEWLQQLRTARKSPRTIEGYGRDVRLALTWMEASLGRPVEVGDLTQERLRRYLAEKAANQHATTENRYISALNSLFLFLVEEQYMPVMPKLVRPMVPRRLPRALSQAEAAQLVEAPRMLMPLVGHGGRSRRYREVFRTRDTAVLEVFYATGVRPSDLITIRTGGVEIREVPGDDGTPVGEVLFRLIGKGNQERVVAGRGPVVDFVRAYLARRDELRPKTDALFLNRCGGALGRNGVREIVVRWARAVGLTVFPRMLRHSCAKHLVDEGVHLRYVQELLGHRSPATTAIYTQLSGRELGEACAARHPRARLPPAVPPEEKETPQPVEMLRRAFRLVMQAGRAAVASMKKAA